LLVDADALESARIANDTVLAQEILQDAFRTDVRPLLAEARRNKGGSLNPLRLYRELNVREVLINERGVVSKATGL